MSFCEVTNSVISNSSVPLLLSFLPPSESPVSISSTSGSFSISIGEPVSGTASPSGGVAPPNVVSSAASGSGSTAVGSSSVGGGNAASCSTI
jgi:hypothetical protein